MRVYTATNKESGKKWTYATRRCFNKSHFAFAGVTSDLENLIWKAKLSEAKEAAIKAGIFAYDGEAND